MKNSYPDSLITLAAAITKACSLHVHSNEKGNSPVTTGVSTIHHSSINNNAVVGIKFDTMSARKYFVLIHTAQQNVVLNKTREKYDNLLLPIPPKSGTKANQRDLLHLGRMNKSRTKNVSGTLQQIYQLFFKRPLGGRG